jgi:hypothetical protein
MGRTASWNCLQDEGRVTEEEEELRSTSPAALGNTDNGGHGSQAATKGEKVNLYGAETATSAAHERTMKSLYTTTRIGCKQPSPGEVARSRAPQSGGPKTSARSQTQFVLGLVSEQI